MDKIVEAFRKYFNNNVDIPNILNQSGTIYDSNKGWDIKYVVLEDEKGEKYLDFLAVHRMTNDRHCRIFSDGKIKYLETYMESYAYNPEIKGDEERELQKYYKHNTAVSKILIEKGLSDE